MKKNVKHWMLILFSLATIWVACTESAEEDPEPTEQNNNDTTQVDNDTTQVDDDPTDPNTLDFNALTNDLVLENASTMTGNFPIPDLLAGLAVGKDTLAFTRGVRSRLRMKFPGEFHYGQAFFMRIKGADNYLQGMFVEEESSDSIAVAYMEFDDEDWNLPLQFEVEIVATDDTGAPVGPIDLPVEVEGPLSGSCGFLPGDQIWEWIYTTQNGEFVSAPMTPHPLSGTVAGCCDDTGTSWYGNCIGGPSEAHVDYTSYQMVPFEYIKFVDGENLIGETLQITQNVRPSESDFCSGTPGYSVSEPHNHFYGTYTYNAGGCTIRINELNGETSPLYTSSGNYLGEFPKPLYVGAGDYAEYHILSRHFIKEVRNVEGSNLERIYESRTSEIPF